MFLKVTRSGPRRYLQLVEAYRDADTGRPKQRHVATLGRLDRLAQGELDGLIDGLLKDVIDPMWERLARPLARAGLSPNQVTAMGLARPEFLTVPVEDGVELNAWMIKPPDFDPAKSYPLLIYVYGEPAGQTVLNRWQGSRGLFHRALAA